jgi:hypothetical protein
VPVPVPLAEETDAGGLMAFTSEAAPAIPAPPTPPTAKSRALFGVLATLVVLEAIPSVLWVKGYFTAPVAPAVASALPPPAAPPMIAAPCDASATAASAPAATGDVRPAAATPPAATPAAVPASMLAGHLSVAAPVPMHVYARGRLVGTTEAETIMLPVGSHELLLENTAVGFRVTRTVAVQAGRTSSLRLDAPNGTLNVNAVPWAEVWLDKQRLGETPIGNLQAPIGSHDVVFRHPEFGEKRTSVLVTLKGPVRVSMDMRTK